MSCLAIYEVGIVMASVFESEEELVARLDVS